MFIKNKFIAKVKETKTPENNQIINHETVEKPVASLIDNDSKSRSWVKYMKLFAREKYAAAKLSSADEKNFECDLTYFYLDCNAESTAAIAYQKFHSVKEN